MKQRAQLNFSVERSQSWNSPNSLQSCSNLGPMLWNFFVRNFRNKQACSSLTSPSSLVLCLWARQGAYPREEQQKVSSIGLAPDLPTNIRLGWKSLPGTNTLAYCKHLQITAVKSTKGEVSLYHWPPVWLVWNQLYDYWQFLFLFAKQTNPNQSNRRSTVQWYFHL